MTLCTSVVRSSHSLVPHAICIFQTRMHKRLENRERVVESTVELRNTRGFFVSSLILYNIHRIASPLHMWHKPIERSHVILYFSRPFFSFTCTTCNVYFSNAHARAAGKSLASCWKWRTTKSSQKWTSKSGSWKPFSKRRSEPEEEEWNVL